MHKRALPLVGVAFIVSSLSACGGGSPTDAAPEEFCSGFNNLTSNLAKKIGPDVDSSEAMADLKDETRKISDIGTPKDIPGEAREGFEIFTESLLSLDDDMSLKDFDLEKELNEDENAKTDTFVDYLEKTCSG